MGIKDPHDRRPMTHFAKLNADGTVAAIVEVADESVALNHPSADGNIYVDVTELRQQRIDPFLVTVDTKELTAVRDDAGLKAHFTREARKANGRPE